MLDRSATYPSKINFATIEGQQLDQRGSALRVHRFTHKQSAALTAVSLSYVNAACRATDAERQQLERGQLSVSNIHNRKRRPPLTDTEVVRILVELGPERVYRALDQLTQPELPFVAA